MVFNHEIKNTFFIFERCIRSKHRFLDFLAKRKRRTRSGVEQYFDIFTGDFLGENIPEIFLTLNIIFSDDKTRVRLPVIKNIAGSDYINASHISVSVSLHSGSKTGFNNTQLSLYFL